ncbi:MAG: UDP-N-acetylmuramoyl-tripeptide--D-alanyl-D-alanine ligase [Kiritimatiellia bacterium]|nr:UDP-N-acetylmuramoyl-tripeptide--D-alanyl-D-alanine ligase [Kiritimatiellia bacterium]
MPVFDPDDLAAWCGGTWTSRPRAPLRRIWQDSRSACPGDLYVALRGPRFDGHAFLAQAFTTGASAALVARTSAVPQQDSGPLLLCDDPENALTAIAIGHRERYACGRVGVTGSVGKTSVKNLSAAALSALGPTARTLGNWNNKIGLPLSLLTLEPDHRFGVFEVGMNHPGELRPLCALLSPRWAVITRIGPVHIEFFESEEAIAREKATLLEALPRDGFAVLATDEPWFELLRERAPCRIVTVAQSGRADYLARPDPSGIRIRERDGTEFLYPASLPGAPGRANTARAVALARELGASPDAVAAALTAAPLDSMRWQRSVEAGVIWINDAYNANPTSVDAALTMFAESETAPRKWLVLGGMGELGAHSDEAHRQLGHRIAEGDWAGLIACGDAAQRLATGAAEAGMDPGRILCARDTGTAADLLAEHLREGDAVLLKGSRSERIETVFQLWKTKAAGAPARKDLR